MHGEEPRRLELWRFVDEAGEADLDDVFYAALWRWLG